MKREIVKINTINIVDDQKSNISVTNLDLVKFTIHCKTQGVEYIHRNNIYEVTYEDGETKNLNSIKPVNEADDVSKYRDYCEVFSIFPKRDPNGSRVIIEEYLGKIENIVLKDITTKMYDDLKKKFYIHPAATSFHHNYKGGLAYHTSTMLKIADGLLNIYHYINKDLVYSAIILHDIYKSIEIEADGKDYSVDGSLLGHISMSSANVLVTAEKLGYKNKQEVVLLQHIILSHHGKKEWGSPVEPKTPEALLVHYCDNIDSKLAVIGEVFEDAVPGDMTSKVGVMGWQKLYKHNINNEK